MTFSSTHAALLASFQSIGSGGWKSANLKEERKLTFIERLWDPRHGASNLLSLVAICHFCSLPNHIWILHESFYLTVEVRKLSISSTSEIKIWYQVPPMRSTPTRKPFWVEQLCGPRTLSSWPRNVPSADSMVIAIELNQWHKWTLALTVAPGT